jgi:hypothetical protein
MAVLTEIFGKNLTYTQNIIHNTENHPVNYSRTLPATGRIRALWSKSNFSFECAVYGFTYLKQDCVIEISNFMSVPYTG